MLAASILGGRIGQGKQGPWGPDSWLVYQGAGSLGWSGAEGRSFIQAVMVFERSEAKWVEIR